MKGVDFDADLDSIINNVQEFCKRYKMSININAKSFGPVFNKKEYQVTVTMNKDTFLEEDNEEK